jgi:hypothetical protein
MRLSEAKKPATDASAVRLLGNDLASTAIDPEATPRPAAVQAGHHHPGFPVRVIRYEVPGLGSWGLA